MRTKIKHVKLDKWAMPLAFEATIDLVGAGKLVYLWIGDSKGICRGTISDKKLYRLAKNIVKEFEKDASMKRRKDEG